MGSLRATKSVTQAPPKAETAAARTARLSQATTAPSPAPQSAKPSRLGKPLCPGPLHPHPGETCVDAHGMRLAPGPLWVFATCTVQLIEDIHTVSLFLGVAHYSFLDDAAKPDE